MFWRALDESLGGILISLFSNRKYCICLTCVCWSTLKLVWGGLKLWYPCLGYRVVYRPCVFEPPKRLQIVFPTHKSVLKMQVKNNLNWDRKKNSTWGTPPPSNVSNVLSLSYSLLCHIFKLKEQCGIVNKISYHIQYKVS